MNDSESKRLGSIGLRLSGTRKEQNNIAMHKTNSLLERWLYWMMCHLVGTYKFSEEITLSTKKSMKCRSMKVYKKIFKIRDKADIFWMEESELDKMELMHMEEFGTPYQYVILGTEIIASMVEPDEEPPIIKVHIPELLN